MRLYIWLLFVYFNTRGPYAIRRRVEMHGDFTGGVGSMAWLGLAWLLRGWGVEGDGYR